MTPGDAGRLVKYANERAKAIGIVFPGIDDASVAYLDTLRVLGIPLITTDGYEGEGWFAATAGDAVTKGMEQRGIRVTVTAIPIPMHCSPAFEGKSIRKEEMFVEFGGGRSPAFELFRMRDASEVQDGRVTLTGPEIDSVKEGSAVPLAENLAIAKELLPRMKAIHSILEVEIGVVGGEEDGVSHDINEKLYTTLDDAIAMVDALGLGEQGRYMAALTFGNVHGDYKPGNVKLRPELLAENA